MIIPKEIKTAQLAKLLGISVRQVQVLVDKEGLPKEGYGKFETIKCVRWYIDYWRDHDRNSMYDEKHAMLVQQRVKIELENESNRRKLLPIDEVQTVFNKALASLASVLDSLGPRMANELASNSDPGDIKNVVFAETREIRREFARALESLADDPDSGQPDNKPAAAEGRRAVGRPRKNTTA